MGPDPHMAATPSSFRVREPYMIDPAITPSMDSPAVQELRRKRLTAMDVASRRAGVIMSATSADATLPSQQEEATARRIPGLTSNPTSNSLVMVATAASAAGVKDVFAQAPRERMLQLHRAQQLRAARARRPTTYQNLSMNATAAHVMLPKEDASVMLRDRKLASMRQNALARARL